MNTNTRPSKALLRSLYMLILVVMPTMPSAGQDTVPSAAPNNAPAVSFSNDFQSVAGRLDDRFVSLAEAIPGERYSWRPAEGVRSVSEVLMHVAQVNFFSARSVGAQLPADLPQDLSKVTEKAKVLALLRSSFKTSGGAAKAMAGADVSQPLPGGGMTLGGAMLSYAEHQGEHLGQLIAYARGLGVTPPWSR